MAKEYFTHGGRSIFSREIIGDKVNVAIEKIYVLDFVTNFVILSVIQIAVIAYLHDGGRFKLAPMLVIAGAITFLLMSWFFFLFGRRQQRCRKVAQELQAAYQALHTDEVERERKRLAAEAEARRKAEAARQLAALREKERQALLAWERDVAAIRERQGQRLKELEAQFLAAYRTFGYEAQLRDPNLSEREVAVLFRAQLARHPIAAHPDAGLLHQSQLREVDRVKGGRPLPLREAPALPPRPR